MTGKELYQTLSRNCLRYHFDKRLRIAVTAEEYSLMREHALREWGVFQGMVRGFKLVIDDNATDPQPNMEIGTP